MPFQTVYIPHSSDKTRLLGYSDFKVKIVYIPHSSDKTNSFEFVITTEHEFTSLIVQIKPYVSPDKFEYFLKFTSLIVQIKQYVDRWDVYETTGLHPS